MLTKLQSIVEMAQKRGPKRFAVAGAHGLSILKAIQTAQDLDIMTPVLIGNKKEIIRFAREIELDIKHLPIYDIIDNQKIARKAAELVHKGEADAVMKGNILTPILLKAILNKKYDLRSGQLLSHVGIMEIPAYHKLILITDSGMVIRPTLEQKIGILQNAIQVLRRLGVDPIKIAILSATEKINPAFPETLDADQLVRMTEEGKFGNVIVEGPMALDIAFSRESADIKKYPSKVAGDPDVLLIPDVSCGNILAKGLVYLAGARICGVIVGAKIPVSLISRAEHAQAWVSSIALTSVLA
jgi:phosphate butyryltransferase